MNKLSLTLLAGLVASCSSVPQQQILSSDSKPKPSFVNISVYAVNSNVLKTNSPMIFKNIVAQNQAKKISSANVVLEKDTISKVIFEEQLAYLKNVKQQQGNYVLGMGVENIGLDLSISKKQDDSLNLNVYHSLLSNVVLQKDGSQAVSVVSGLESSVQITPQNNIFIYKNTSNLKNETRSDLAYSNNNSYIINFDYMYNLQNLNYDYIKYDTAKYSITTFDNGQLTFIKTTGLKNIPIVLIKTSDKHFEVVNFKIIGDYILLDRIISKDDSIALMLTNNDTTMNGHKILIKKLD